MLAAVDLEQLGQEIAASARRAEKNSPEFLRRQITDLQAAAG